MLASAVDFQFRREIPIEHIAKPSIDKLDEEVFHLDHIFPQRQNKTLPKDKVESQKLQHIATRYILIREFLCKKNHIPDCITIHI